MTRFLLWYLLISNYLIGNSGTSMEPQRVRRSMSIYRRARTMAKNIKFLVCTREKKNCVYYKTRAKAKIIDPYKMTKVLVHGWQNDEESEMPQLLKKYYLKYQDVNVIIVGWGEYARRLDYNFSVAVKRSIAKYITMFLVKNLRTENPELNLHLIGHSLGAHICGYVGLLLQKQNFLAYRITGLDPALPLVKRTLGEEDAYFVDIIHTCSGTLGVWAPSGHADFYPNGGMLPQPSCTLIAPQCSHSYSWKLYAQTIINGKEYLATRCSSYVNYLIGYCEETLYMGEDAHVFGRGSFYVST